MELDYGNDKEVRIEATLGAVFLPKCPNCGSAHPMAISRRIDPTICPSCNGPAATPGEEVVVPAVLQGARGAIARACFFIANKLDKLQRRL